MIVNTGGVVLSRRSHREYDRLCTIYTEQFGKIPVRFIGVNRPRGKMKALSEPGVWGEYRLHLSPRSEFAKGVGGRLVTSFPSLRTSLNATFDALACCEMLERLTPDHQPGPEKYKLLCTTLAALDETASRWLVASFGLRLADRLGLSLRERAPSAASAVWHNLHETELGSLVSLQYDENADEAARRLLDEHLGAHAGRRLRAFEFRENWHKTVDQGVPA